MRRLYLLLAPVAALGLVVALLVHASAFGTPAGAAPRIACRPGQPCASFGVMTTANPGAIGNRFFATAVISSSDIWAAGQKWEVAGSVARGSAARGPKQGCGCAYYALIEHYNGSTWSVVSQPAQADASSEILGMAVISSNDVWAVGDYINPMTAVNEKLIEHWNGSAWSIIAGAALLPAEKLYAVTGVASNDVWAVGSYFDASFGQLASLTEHWNGATWSVVSSPNAMSGANAISSPLASVTAIASNDVWAVGSAGLNTISSLIEHWDGAQWSIVSSPVPGGQGFEFTGVSGSASNDVWVVGSYFGTPFALKPLIEHWNGSTWTIVPSYPAPDGAEIMSVVATGVSDAWATGYKSDLNDVVTLLVYRWNGATWTQQPGLALGIGNFLVGFGVSAVAVSPDGTTLVASTNQDAGTLAMLLGRRLR